MTDIVDEPIYPSFSILVFTLNDQHYALPLSHIQQILVGPPATRRRGIGRALMRHALRPLRTIAGTPQ